jgi:hypothetical protein
MSMKEKSLNASIRWAGCSDNVLFGSELARKFVNLRERISKNRTSLLKVHNNQVGIRVKNSFIFYLISYDPVIRFFFFLLL